MPGEASHIAVSLPHTCALSLPSHPHTCAFSLTPGHQALKTKALMPCSASTSIWIVCRCCEKGDPPTNVYRCTTCYSKFGVAMNKRIPQMTSSTGTKVVDHPAINALRAIASNSTKKDLDVHVRPFVRLVKLHGVLSAVDEVAASPSLAAWKASVCPLAVRVCPGMLGTSQSAHACRLFQYMSSACRSPRGRS